MPAGGSCAVYIDIDAETLLMNIAAVPSAIGENPWPSCDAIARLDNRAEYAFFVDGSLYQSLVKLRVAILAESFAIDRPRSDFWFLYGDRAGLATPAASTSARWLPTCRSRPNF